MISFVLTVVIEMPCQNLFRTFVLDKKEAPISLAFYQTNSQGPPSGQPKRKGGSTETSPMLVDGTESLDTDDR